MKTYLATLPDFVEGSKRCVPLCSSLARAELTPDRSPACSLDVRPTHLAHAAVGHKQGWIGPSPLPRPLSLAPALADAGYQRHPLTPAVTAGATFADDARTKMTGSWFCLREESLAKARERLSRDVYATGGAWDMSKVRRCLALALSRCCSSARRARSRVRLLESISAASTDRPSSRARRPLSRPSQ